MTKQEIKEAIAKGIAGQGTNVDGGGYLPKILEAIVDAIPEGAVAPEPTIIIADSDFVSVDESEAAMTLNITLDELRALPNQSVIGTSDGVTLTRIYYRGGENYSVIFGNEDILANFGRSIALSKQGDSYTLIVAKT